MNREIKFRAWTGKTMFFPTQITFANCGWSVQKGFGVSIPAQPHIKLMQFTGLLDKNGKEIYEGDIIRGHYNIGGEEWEFIKGEVKFGIFESSGDGQGFGDDKILGFYIDGEPSKDKGMYEISSSLVAWEHLKIIGNIYENPELLKENK